MGGGEKKQTLEKIETVKGKSIGNFKNNMLEVKINKKTN